VIFVCKTKLQLSPLLAKERADLFGQPPCTKTLQLVIFCNEAQTTSDVSNLLAFNIVILKPVN